MIVKNITDEKKPLTKIILQKLKMTKDDPEVIINPGQIVDLSYYIPDEKRLKNNTELKQYLARGLLVEISQEDFEKMTMPKTEEEKKEIQEKAQKTVKQQKIDDIIGSSSLTFLQDIAESDPDRDVVEAAMKRLVELEGELPDNPELRESNPII